MKDKSIFSKAGKNAFCHFAERSISNTPIISRKFSEVMVIAFSGWLLHFHVKINHNDYDLYKVIKGGTRR